MRNELRLSPAMLGDRSTASRRARHEVEHFLIHQMTPPMCEAAVVGDVVLAVSELVSNAVRHADASPEVVVRRTTVGEVIVEVSDPMAGMAGAPTQWWGAMAAVTGDGCADPPVLEVGRGLNIVAAIATMWGVSTRGGDGKTVWANFALPDARRR